MAKITHVQSKSHELGLTFTIAEGLYEAAEKAVRLSGKQLAS